MWLVWIHYKDFPPKVNPLDLQFIIIQILYSVKLLKLTIECTLGGLSINTLIKSNWLILFNEFLIKLLVWLYLPRCSTITNDCWFYVHFGYPELRCSNSSYSNPSARITQFQWTPKSSYSNLVTRSYTIYKNRWSTNSSISLATFHEVVRCHEILYSYIYVH